MRNYTTITFQHSLATDFELIMHVPIILVNSGTFVLLNIIIPIVSDTGVQSTQNTWNTRDINNDA